MNTFTTKIDKNIKAIKELKPLNAVFLRILYWACKRNKNLSIKEANSLYQPARIELGRKLTKGQRAGSNAFQKLRDDLGLHGSLPQQVAEYQLTDWWQQRLPSHANCRMISGDLFYEEYQASVYSENSLRNKQNYSSWRIQFRNPSLPVCILSTGVFEKQIPQFDIDRGVYFRLDSDGIYIGQTTNAAVRFGTHKRKHQNTRWILVESAEQPEPSPSIDALNATERLLIGFWSEVIYVNNKRGGASFKEPNYPSVRDAFLLTEAASAAIIWLAREKGDILGFSLPFKSPNYDGWHSEYLKPFIE